MDKKKVAVISSYYHNWNMGGLLQAYALNQSIRRLGYEAEHIRFCYAEPMEAGTFSQRIRTKLTRHRATNELIDRYFTVRQHQSANRRGFYDFHNHYIHGGPCCDAATAGKLNGQYDIFVTGSDQIWNPEFWSDRLLGAFGLNFAGKSKRTVSYAASIGSEKAAEGKETLFGRILGDLDCVSVREAAARDFLQPLTEKDVFVAVDPTLLLQREDWETIIVPPKAEKPYLFAYFLEEDNPHTAQLHSIAQRENLPIRCVATKRGIYPRSGVDQQIFDADPRAFLGLIHEAEVLVTNSFHGMVFAALFHKPFWVVKRYADTDKASANHRITDFLREFGLEDRLLEDGVIPTDTQLHTPIDFDRVDTLLQEKREKSLAWLQAALSSELPHTEKKKTILITGIDRETCSGCGACAAICPAACITMAADQEGFSYPLVDAERCMHCGRCQRVCPVANRSPEREIQKAYGVQAKDDALRRESSSGGVFTLLAAETLAAGGAVFGAALSGDCRTVAHRKAEQLSDLAALRGSKYVQSDTKDTYRQVRECLLTGKKVLYSGTPCQIAGLRAYLGRDDENLLCVGIICHGTPSPALWRRYVDYRIRQCGSPMVMAAFRDKCDGWASFGMRLTAADGQSRFVSAGQDPYMRMFLQNKCLRPSCYACAAKGGHSGADILLGDFWGVQAVEKRLHDDKGTSLVLTFTEKGAAAVDKVLEACRFYEVDAHKAIAGNSAFDRSVEKPAARETFFADMNCLSFAELAEKYAAIGKKERVIHLLERLHLLELACKILGK